MKIGLKVLDLRRASDDCQLTVNLTNTTPINTFPVDYKYSSSFARDAKKVVPGIQAELSEVIETIKTAQNLNDIPGVKKIKGHKSAYRIKVNNFRLCFFYGDDKVLILTRFLPRKDVYRFFP